MKRAAAALLCVLATLGAAPQLDSQIVVARYERALGAVREPAASIFTYSVSQAGSGDIESRHRIYRTGSDVRDETIGENGQALKRKRVIIEKRVNHYAVTRLAPRTSSYRFLFLRTVKDGSHLDYVFETVAEAPESFTVTGITIDGLRFLPRNIAFTTASASAKGSGSIDYQPAGAFWMPAAVSVSATVDAKPARERITFADYRFPPSLPPSTFATPRPLPQATLPSF